MSHHSRWPICLALLLTGSLASPQTPDMLRIGGLPERSPSIAERPASRGPYAEEMLRSVGFASDGADLLRFFQKRTLSQYRLSSTGDRRTIEPMGADRDRIAGLIRRLDDGSFAVREQASRELLAIGLPALGLLRKAVEQGEPEVKRRATAIISAIEDSPGGTLPRLAVRLLRQKQPPGACAALVAYLPFVHDDVVEEEVLYTLAALGVKNGKLDPALTEALKSPDPQRRAGSALVVGHVGDRDARPVVRLLLQDADAKVRLRAAQGLIAGRELGAVPTLVGLLADAPLPVARQAEDMLARLAGERAPRVELEDTPLARRRCQEAWSVWWRNSLDRLELTRGPDLLVLNPGQRARDAAERFLNAYLAGDGEAMRALTELPFLDLAAPRVIRTRQGLEQLMQDLLNFRGDQNTTFTIRRDLSVSEYSRWLSQPERTLLAKYRRPEVRVVIFEIVVEDPMIEGDTFGHLGAFVIRVGNGGQATLITIGPCDRLE